MKELLVSRRFDFVRNYIQTMLGRGFRRQRMRTVIAEVLNTFAGTPKMEAALSSYNP
jgi:hypothetical protein